MPKTNFDPKDKAQVTKLFSDFKQFLQEHDIGSILINVQDILPSLGILLDDKIIATDTDMQNNGGTIYLIVRIYTMHGLKIIVKLTNQGNVYSWVEGIHESDCYCSQ